MYRCPLIALFLTVCLFGCSAPTPEQTAQDPNVTPDGFEGEDADLASAEMVNWFEEHLVEKP